MFTDFLSCCSQKSGDLASVVGRPTAALCPLGQCAFNEVWRPATLVDRTQVTHNVILLTFALPNARQPLNLPTCACILTRYTDDEDVGGEPKTIVRPYTPISTNALQGQFLLLVKVYKNGKMSQYLNNLMLGSSMEFSHIAENVKLQYPFGKKHITMIVGGTGITPIIQALHAILGTADDATQVTLFFGNRTQTDILGKELLESWSANSCGRLKVFHLLSEAAADDNSENDIQVRHGFITRDLLEEHSPAPSEDSMVMLCGPPPMCSVFCGGVVVVDGAQELSGILKDIGYTSEQVYTF
eukprot:TRINITY_DN60056_c0_g1_i1.p1 TRINITY_DN60056_c0_g1~~TRINITY_DN60056_c0_g1_i1.p1  ORF type:complete len:311 (-),score=35.00 TRINITY_DN60056_c0_g1_i1:164-1060(-)